MRTGVLVGQVVLVLVLVTAGVWCGTQYCAWRLGYQARLGPPWVVVANFAVYQPWRLFQWWYAYDAYAPEVFRRGGMIAATGSVVAAGASMAMSVVRARVAKRTTTYGSSRWATPREIVGMGLTDCAGFILGRIARAYLRHDGAEHVMVIAPTRSGKGVGLVVPTLLSWTGSAVINDVKAENYALTSGWRSRFSHVLYFNPTDTRSAAYNPLFEVRRGPQEIRDVQNIADILVDPEGALERRNHWEKTSHALLVGSILHVLYATEDKTLRGVANFLSDPSCSFETTLHRMMTTLHLGDRTHPVVAAAARELLNKSDNERSGVLSTALSFLGLYRDPIVAEVTSRCDWRIADLIGAERPVSLYLVVPPSDISRTKPLIRLMLNQMGRRLTESLDGSDGIERRHRLLLMLDEFPALGRLDFFETALAYMAGYGLRAFLISQSLNQIDKAYGVNNSILDNCHIRVAFAANDERTARRLSDALGTATEVRAQANYAGHRLAPWLSHLMVSRQESPRPLLTPGEIMQLPAHAEIVMLAGHPPIHARKLKYYEDRNFLARLRPPPPLSTNGYADQPRTRPDDWSAHPPLAVPPDATAAVVFEDALAAESVQAYAPATPRDDLSMLDDPDESGRAWQRHDIDRDHGADAGEVAP